MFNSQVSHYLDAQKQHPEYWVEKAKLDFAAMLDGAQRRSRLSDADLAKHAGIGVNCLKRILRGDANLTIEEMARLVFAATNGKQKRQ